MLFPGCLGYPQSPQFGPIPLLFRAGMGMQRLANVMSFLKFCAVIALGGATALAAGNFSEPAVERAAEVRPVEESGDTLAQVERYLNDIKSLTATFIQEAPDGI